MREKDTEVPVKTTRATIVIFVIFFIASALVPYWHFIGFGWDSISNKISDWGQTGDFFGGILNPAFGFLTVILLLRTLEQNEKSLKQSEEELKLSREEMKRSADALSEQSKDLKQQTFERTFFELVRLHNEIVNAFVIKQSRLMNHLHGQSAPLSDMGRDALLVYCGNFKNRLLSHMQTNPDEEQTEAMNKVWLEFYKDKQNQLGHYFRSLYNIIKFVDQSKIENNKFYIDLLRAQLSSPELLVIFYNANSDMGREKLLPLLTKYNLLKHLAKDELVFRD